MQENRLTLCLAAPGQGLVLGGHWHRMKLSVLISKVNTIGTFITLSALITLLVTETGSHCTHSGRGWAATGVGP
jgi:hypothetical protein